MNKQFVDFRWGLPELDKEEESYVKVYDFMLEHYAEAGLSRDEFLLILHLAKYHFNTPKGKSRPSLESIAKYMGYAHINSVRRLVQSLERKGLLSIQHIDGKPSVYNVHGFAAKMRQLQHAKCSPTLEYTPTLACTPTPTSQGGAPLHPNVPHPYTGVYPKQSNKKRKEEKEKQAVEAASESNVMHEAPDSPTTAPVYDPTFDERDELIGSLGIGDPVRTQLLNDPFLTLEYLRGKVPQMWAEGKTKGLAVIIFRQHEPLTPSEVRASLYGDTHTEESQAQGGALSIFDQNHREPGNARLYREREHAAQPFVGGAFRDVVD